MIGVAIASLGLVVGCNPAAPGVETPPVPSEASAVELLRAPPTKWKPRAKPRAWKYIVLHHTATGRGSVESIHESHLRRKWLGIGYHFLVGNGNGMPDGRVEATFRWRQQLQGAHAGTGDYNERGIGIALVGNFDESKPTDRQLAAVKELVAALADEYRIGLKSIVPHRDLKATACPGKHFPLDDVIRVARSRDVQLADSERDSR